MKTLIDGCCRQLPGLLILLMALLVALIFLWFGYPFAQFGFDQESDLTGINMLAIDIAWPLAGLAYLVFLGETLVADVRVFRCNLDE